VTDNYSKVPTPLTQPKGSSGVFIFGVFMTKHVTRIAPSPTGLFHLGSARTALFNWLAAKATGGQFILRIDDTDTKRNSPEAVQVIYDAMSWLGLDYDVSFRQSDRLNIYKDLADKLVNADLAFRDDDGAIRLRLPTISGPWVWEDTIITKCIITDTDKTNMDGLCIIRSDGTPTYQFASVVDDMEYEVTWVIRGTDHISNTPKQLAIVWALEKIGMAPWKPLWTHIGMITQDKKKLSKRDGAASVLNYRDQGIDPDALCNWMLRMGWGPHVDDRSTKMITKERAVEMFLTHGKMRSAPSNMDVAMLRFLDTKYKGTKERMKK
jgi:glutamyl-tRNA synthetase